MNRELEFIMKDLVQNARKAVKDVKASDQIPHPSSTLHLSDETLSGSNLFAIQKLFDGKFQFDVFFESRSARQTLSCMRQMILPTLARLTHP
jgi:mannosyl-oligosaccharide glucosidase